MLSECFGKEDLEDQDEEDSKKPNNIKIDATKDVTNSPHATQIDPLISDDLIEKDSFVPNIEPPTAKRGYQHGEFL